MSVAFELHRETEDAKALLQTYQDILGEDAQARADLVEGETSLREVIEAAVARVAEIDGQLQGLNAMAARIKSRASRLEKQAETLRTLIGTAMEIGGMRKLDLPLGTVTSKPVPPSVRIVNEAMIPTQFWKRSAPTLDKRALLAALKEEGAQVPGAELSNGGSTIAIKFT